MGYALRNLPEGHDVPWGTGAGKTEAFLKELHRQGVQPKMFGLEYSYDWYDSMPKVSQCVRFFNETTQDIAQVEEWVAADPYGKAGLFESLEIVPWNRVIG